MNIDDLRNLFIVPEWIMALVMSLAALSFLVRWRCRIISPKLSLMLWLSTGFGNMGVLYWLIHLSGNRAGLSWMVRAWLLLFAVVILVVNLTTILGYFKWRQKLSLRWLVRLFRYSSARLG